MLSLNRIKICVVALLVTCSAPAYASGDPIILMIFFLGLVIVQLLFLATHFVLSGKNLSELMAFVIFGVMGWIGLLSVPAKITEEFEVFWNLNTGSSMYYSAAFFLLFIPYILLKIWKKMKCRKTL